MSQTKVFDRLLEKATSNLLLENDWESILKICDLIRQDDVASKYAVSSVKKKLTSDNIHTIGYTLECIESMVKNCGSKIHQEIVQKDFMEQMKSLCQQKPDPVKSKCLSLIQCWSHAFRKNPNYKIVEDYYNQMKMEGFQFPLLKESEAMFDVEEAPLWIQDSDSTSCFRCRSEFGIINRRHHCRACGQIFCHACSSKQAPIPKFGIEKEVRVCDGCFDKLKSTSAASGENLSNQFMKPALSNNAAQLAPKQSEKTEQEFEEELQLALALSESEAEAKHQQQSKFKSYSHKSAEKNSKISASAPSYNDSNYSNQRDQVKETNKIRKDNYQSESQVVKKMEAITTEADEKEIENDAEIDKFNDDVKKILELFINRMKADSVRGRSITNDTAVQSLFLQLQHLQPKLMSYIKYKEDMRGYYENLQDKLTQLKDAREVLNALRQEHYEKKRKEFEEKERLRQMQIAQKLQYMRQQKQSYYLYQQQLHMQKLQEQEMSLKMRLNQQRELVMQRELINTVPGTLNYQNSTNPMMQTNFYQNPMYPLANNSNSSFAANGMEQNNQLQNGETNLNNLPPQNWPMNQNQFIPNTNLPNQPYPLQSDATNSMSTPSMPGMNQYQMNFSQGYNQPSQPFNPMINYGQPMVQQPMGQIANQMNYSSYGSNSMHNQSSGQAGQTENREVEPPKIQENVSDVQLISFD
ncbi:hepatocyte growth factor-regulated tyrosine kinase substrate isoform X2 [Brachionus plicatilis]|uniref:Hepatocyte growth factor-regulated tyrosine kinase substrate n=1 Tax=Brachionus plicatilis TaxID=10195 RepID=A0A3M7TBD7_BRAPC|nr:hepatocyte growth factor-regulated tyrosine kinase substrate isoform X2 [Brachionus plicatilis]